MVKKARKPKGFTLKALIKIINDAYPSDWDDVMDAFLDENNSGDTLALFIAREVTDTFPVKGTNIEKLTTAYNAMMKAEEQIRTVVAALRRRITDEFTKQLRLR